MSRFTFKRFPTKIGEIYSGCAPEIETLELIKKNNIYCIWNLGREQVDLLEKEKQYVDRVLFANIRDYSIPDDKEHFLQQLNEVCDLLKEGKSVFLHCWFGHGRTGMTLACIKRELEGATSEVALAASQAHCKGPEDESQVEFVQNLFKKVV